MQIERAANRLLSDIMDLVGQLSAEQYARPCQTLSGASIGQHVRHTVELFQCLEKGYAAGLVNYEERPRDPRMEQDPVFALEQIAHCRGTLTRPNRDLVLIANYTPDSRETVRLVTNHQRELAYNLEHAVHHMALIRIGVQEVSDLVLPPAFGVAISTLKHRGQCAQ